MALASCSFFAAASSSREGFTMEPGVNSSSENSSLNILALVGAGKGGGESERAERKRKVNARNEKGKCARNEKDRKRGTKRIARAERKVRPKNGALPPPQSIFTLFSTEKGHCRALEKIAHFPPPLQNYNTYTPHRGTDRPPYPPPSTFAKQNGALPPPSRFLRYFLPKKGAVGHWEK